MKNNNNTLEKLFEKARDSEVLVSKSKAADLLKPNATYVPKNTMFNIFNRWTKMHTISSLIIGAAAISFFTLGNFMGGGTSLNQDDFSNDRNIAIEQPNLIGSKKDNKNEVNKSDNNDVKIASAKQISSTKKHDNSDKNDNKDKNTDVNGVNFIELSQEELKSLGIEISPDGKFVSYYNYFNNKKNATLVDRWDINVNWGVSFKQNLPRNEDIKYFSPKVVTDNAGKERLVSFSSNAMFVDDPDMFAKIENQSIINNEDAQRYYDSSYAETLGLFLDTIRTSLDGKLLSKIDPYLKKQIQINPSNALDSLLRLKNINREDIRIEVKVNRNNSDVIRQMTLDSVANSKVIKITREITTDTNDISISNFMDTDEYIQVNKFVPVKIVVPNANFVNDYNGEMLEGYKEGDEFAFIFWFEPSEEFLEALPNRYQNSLLREISAIEEAESICDIPQTGEESYLDLWRACDGNLENLAVYPNPSDGQIQVRYNLKSARTLTTSLHDLYGRKIKDLSVPTYKNPNEYTESYDISDMNAGMYLIVVKSDSGEQIVQRVIKR